MQHLSQTLKSHPAPKTVESDDVDKWIATLIECAATCRTCADACLAEDMVADLRKCIVTDLDCADICGALASLLIRQTDSNQPLLRSLALSCELACNACAEECEKHAEMHGHCRHCAEACRHCAGMCRGLIQRS